MASYRSIKPKITGQQNQNDMYTFATQFGDLAANIMNESATDIYTDPRRVLMNPRTRGMLKDFFIENSYDPNEFTSAELVKEHIDDMDLQFDNDTKGILENTVTGDMNPLIGMSTAMHKYIIMNNVYDKGAIQKIVTEDQQFTITHQFRYLVTPTGERFDIAKQQNQLTNAIKATNPTKTFEITLPELGTTDFISALNGTSQDRLSVVTKVVAFKIPNVYFEIGDTLPDANGYIKDGNEKATVAVTKDVWYKESVPFTPTYGTNSYKKIIYREIDVTVKRLVNAVVTNERVVDSVSVAMDDKDRIVANSIRGIITGIRIFTRLDTSNAMMPTCFTKWDESSILEVIPDAIPINTTISPDELKDYASLYKMDRLSETMDSIKTVLLNFKDDSIKDELEISYNELSNEYKAFGQFDYAPRQGYADTHVSWIKDTFYFYFDSFITKLYQMYNDPNLTVSIFGDPDMVRKATPTNIIYDSPASIGPVDLDFFKKVSTSDKRVYQWIGSDKLRGDDEFTIILTPTNNNKRITYRIIDYMFYISNEIKNAQNPLLPSIHAYERWKFSQYEPVQARLQILNPSGMRPEDLPDGIRHR